MWIVLWIIIIAIIEVFFLLIQLYWVETMMIILSENFVCRSILFMSIYLCIHYIIIAKKKVELIWMWIKWKIKRWRKKTNKFNKKILSCWGRHYKIVWLDYSERKCESFRIFRVNLAIRCTSDALWMEKQIMEFNYDYKNWIKFEKEIL